MGLKWIPVEDRENVPDKGERILLWQEGKILVSTYPLGSFGSYSLWKDTGVSHWAHVNGPES